MRRFLRLPLALLVATVLVALGASATRQLAGGAVSIALAVPVIVWLGIETSVIEGAVGAILVGTLLDASAGGPAGMLAFLSMMVLLGVRAGAGPFDARTRAGFGILSGAATFLMGVGSIILLRYVSPAESAPGWSLVLRVLMEAILTGFAAPAIRILLDRLLVPSQRENVVVLR